MRVAIFSGYDDLYLEPRPIGLRNLISYPENFGNIVFLESIKRQTNAVNINFIDFVKDHSKYENNFDIFILSLANMISNEYFLDSEILDTLESISKPICIFSIGIQAYDLESLNGIVLNDSVKRILNLSRKHGTIIGVRGTYTYELLHKMGYSNVKIIGCPSIFHYKEGPKIKNVNKVDNVIINGSFHGDWSSEIERLLYFGVKYGSEYLVQSEASILVDKYNITDEILDEFNIEQTRLNYLKNRGYDYKYYTNEFILLKDKKTTGLTSRELSNWLIEKSSFYSNFDEWLINMSRYDMSVGLRLHGSIMSTLAGVPSLILSPDLRVEEVVNYHSLPSCQSTLEIDCLSPDDVYKMIDYSDFYSKFESLRDNYVNFLQDNGLKYYQTY